ncbi:MAG: sensor histidine kinase, partial [Actinobacteria bacterium]
RRQRASDRGTVPRRPGRPPRPGPAATRHRQPHRQRSRPRRRPHRHHRPRRPRSGRPVRPRPRTGFPTDFLPHAFDRFTRADTARTGPGTGLGLAIVAAISRRHGGTAHAGNHPHAGAEVFLQLPTGSAGTRPAPDP